MALVNDEWKNGSRFTTQQFLIGLSFNYILKDKPIYNQAFILGNHQLIGPIYSNLYKIDLHDPSTPYCYERAIKLRRYGRSPYHQNWTSKLMYL
jgi:hypothetical protein